MRAAGGKRERGSHRTSGEKLENPARYAEQGFRRGEAALIRDFLDLQLAAEETSHREEARAKQRQRARLGNRG